MIRENGKFVETDNLHLFRVLTIDEDVEATGILFQGEKKINEDVFEVIDKRCYCNTPEETLNSYVKVMEVRDLDENGMVQADKARVILKRLLSAFTYSKAASFRLIVYSVFILINIGLDNDISAWILGVCALLNISSIKFYRELRNIIDEIKIIKENQEYLEKNNILEYVNSVDDEKDILLFMEKR